MDEDMVASLHLYQYLCKLFGSPEVVKLRRTIYTAAESLVSDDIRGGIPSGSRCEGLEIKASDFDLMFLDKSVTVYETLSDSDNDANNTVSVILDDSETSLGFTRLILPYMYNYNVSERVIRKYQELLAKSFNLNGIHYISSLLVRDSSYKWGIPHGPCQILFKGENSETEALICFRCKNWISLSNPWITRIRKSWPSQQLIDDIIQYGVLFVPVGTKTSNYERIEWRISFSIAEKQLIHSFSHTQLLCYAMLKVVVSDIIKKLHGELLCSYFVKTIMFWMSEENYLSNWFPANLVQCFTSCLQRLIYCVENRDCRHYFLPEINFFENRFNDTDHRDLLSSLYQVYNTGWTALFYTTTFQNFIHLNSLHPDCTSSVVAPCSWIQLLGMNMECSLLYRNIIGLSDFPSKSTKRVLLYVLGIMCKAIIWDNNVYLNGNKAIYKHNKTLLPALVLSTRTDCVSGWCHLASLFYKLKLHRKCTYIVDYCLTKSTRDKHYMAPNTHIKLPIYIRNIVCNSRLFSDVLRLCFIGSVKFRSQSLLHVPEELAFLYNEDNVNVVIPPVVYLFFLKFMCAYHLKQDKDMKLAFRGLQRTVMDELFIVNDAQLLTACRIVELADRLLNEA